MNEPLVNLLVGLGAVLVGYLFGSIPTGVLIGKIFFHQDPREIGSKNSGGTNIARSFGRKFGFLVIALDMLKILAPVFLVWALCLFTPLQSFMSWGVQVGHTTIGGAKVFYWAAGLAAAIGHCWPVFAGFRGGKAVAVFMGVNCLTSWLQSILSGFTYIFLAKKTKFISLTSIIVSLLATLISWVLFLLMAVTDFDFQLFTWSFAAFPFPEYGFEFALMDTVISVILIIRHSSNIKRLKEGTESKNPFAIEK